MVVLAALVWKQVGGRSSAPTLYLIRQVSPDCHSLAKTCQRESCIRFVDLRSFIFFFRSNKPTAHTRPMDPLPLLGEQYDKCGRLLTTKEREKLSERRGQCVACGQATHTPSLLRRKPLTNEHVHKGVCIRCNPSQVPEAVWKEWESKHRPLRAAAKTVSSPMRSPSLSLNQMMSQARLNESMRMNDSLRLNDSMRLSESTRYMDSMKRNESMLNDMSRRSSDSLPVYERDSLRHQQFLDNSSSHQSSLLLDSSERSIRSLQHSSNLRDDIFPEIEWKPSGTLSIADPWPLDDRSQLCTSLHIWRNKGTSPDVPDLQPIFDRYASDPHVLTLACGVVWKLAAVGHVVDVYTESIVCALEDFGDNVLLQQFALGALSLVKDPQAIVDAGGIPTILEALHEPSLLEPAVRCLSGMTEDDAVAFAVLQAGASGKVVNAMDRERAEGVTAMWCLRFLWSMCARDELSDLVVAQMTKAGILPTIGKLLRLPQKDAALLESVAGVVGHVVGHDDSSFVHGQLLECYPTILRLVDTFENDPKLLEHAFRMLCVISPHLSPSEKPVVVEALCVAMKGRLQSLQLRELGLWTVWSIVEDDEVSVDGDLVAHVIDAARRSVEQPASSECIRELATGIENVCLPMGNGPQIASSGHEVGSLGEASELVERALQAEEDESCRLFHSMLMKAQADSDYREILCGDDIPFRLGAGLQTRESVPSGGELLGLLSLICSASSVKLQLPHTVLDSVTTRMLRDRAQLGLCFEALKNICLATASPLDCTAALEFLVGQDVLSYTVDDVSLANEALVTLCRSAPSSLSVSQVQGSVRSICEHLRSTSTASEHPNIDSLTFALSSYLEYHGSRGLTMEANDIQTIIEITQHSTSKGSVDAVRDLLVVLSRSLMTESLLESAVGFVPTIVRVLAVFESDEPVVANACLLLGQAVKVDDLSECVFESGGACALLSACHEFPENACVVQGSCQVFERLLANMPTRKKMHDNVEGIMEVAITWLKLHHGNLGIVLEATSLLDLVVSGLPRDVPVHCGLIPAVISTMNGNEMFPGLIERCLSILRHLSPRSDELASSFRIAGGVEAVLSAVHGELATPGHVESGLVIITTFADHEAVQAIVQLGSVGIVISMLLAYMEYEEIQIVGCQCLSSFADNTECKVLVRDYGGIDCVVYAMWAHPTSFSVQLEACQAIMKLVADRETNEIVLVSENEVVALVSAMRRFCGSEQLQIFVCTTLRNLLLSPDNTRTMYASKEDICAACASASASFPGRCTELAASIVAGLA